MINWTTEKRKVSELKDYDKNPRRITEKGIKDLSASIEALGYIDPIAINQDGTIIGGHARKKTLQKLKLKEVDVRVPDRLLTEQEVQQAIVRLNKNVAGEWDFDKLANNFEAEDLIDWGFTPEELSISVEQVEGLTDEDATPEPPAIPQTVLGDVWILGNHRLMCGDSTSIDAVEKLMNGQKPNTMITDPPYGVKYEANWRADAKGSKKTAREQNSNLQNDDRADWYDAWALFGGAVAYVWHASSFTDVVKQSLEKAGFEIKQQIIWNKNVHALSRSDYHWKHEPCWYAIKKGGDRNWNGGRTQMTVWDVKSIASENGDKTAHPTQKPVEIYTRSLENHTNSGEYTYDPFGGSGTAIIACEKLGRRSLTMELDPKYCDVIIKRWQDFTGKQAINEQTGHTFNTLPTVEELAND